MRPAPKIVREMLIVFYSGTKQVPRVREKWGCIKFLDRNGEKFDWEMMTFLS